MADMQTEATEDYKAGRYRDAIEKYRQIIAADSQNALLYRSLAYCLVSLRRYDEAVQPCYRAIELDPKHGAPHAYLGSIYASRRQYAQAETELRTAIDLSPTMLEARLWLAFILEKQGRLKEEESLLQDATKLDTKNVEIYNALGRCYLRQGRGADARRMAQLASGLSPSPGTDELLRASYLGRHGLTLYRVLHWTTRIVYLLTAVLIFVSSRVQPVFTLPAWILLIVSFAATGVMYVHARQTKRGAVNIVIAILSVLAYLAFRMAYPS